MKTKLILFAIAMMFAANAHATIQKGILAGAEEKDYLPPLEYLEPDVDGASRGPKGVLVGMRDEPSPVPEPMTCLLVGSGLVAIARWRRGK